jgi:hypothetical protein
LHCLTQCTVKTPSESDPVLSSSLDQASPLSAALASDKAAASCTLLVPEKGLGPATEYAVSLPSDLHLLAVTLPAKPPLSPIAASPTHVAGRGNTNAPLFAFTVESASCVSTESSKDQAGKRFHMKLLHIIMAEYQGKIPKHSLID